MLTPVRIKRFFSHGQSLLYLGLFYSALFPHQWHTLRVVIPSHYEFAYLKAGDPFYLDNKLPLVKMTAGLENCLWTKTDSRDYARSDSSFLVIANKETVTVLVGYASRALDLPDWIKKFQEVNESFYSSSSPEGTIDIAYNIYAKTFPPGYIELGGNCIAGRESTDNWDYNRSNFMYTVIIKEGRWPRSLPAGDWHRPHGYLTSPLPFSVVSTDLVRLSAEAWDQESGVRAVYFFASYVDLTGRPVPRTELGYATKKPFTFDWNVSHLPDQNAQSLLFSIDIEDSAGNRAVHAGPRPNYTILDRNKLISDETCFSKRIFRAPRIDGKLSEKIWRGRDSLMIRSENNVVSIKSGWDRKALYFGIRVLDQKIACVFDTQSLWAQDAFELFFDTRHDHNHFLSLDDFHLGVAATGEHLFNVIGMKENVHQFMPNQIQAVSSILGTLNEPADLDYGLTLEIRIPFEDLKLRPAAGRTLGFNIANDDFEEPGDKTVSRFWVGSGNAPFFNASEWGNLTLTESFVRGRWIGGALLSLLLLTLFGFMLRKFSKHPAINPSLRLEEFPEGPVFRAISFLNANYKRNDLDLRMIAQEVHLSPSYFKSLFKKTTRKSFTHYLTEIRILAAKKYLQESALSIGEIADKTGFSSQDYFAKVFYKHVKMTPLKYRQEKRENN